jgi:hypothetical protein
MFKVLIDDSNKAMSELLLKSLLMAVIRLIQVIQFFFLHLLETLGSIFVNSLVLFRLGRPRSPFSGGIKRQFKRLLIQEANDSVWSILCLLDLLSDYLRALELIDLLFVL